jgi:signal peptidase II
VQATRGASLTDDHAPHRRVAALVGVAIGVVTLDLVTKVWVVAALSGEPPVEVVGQWLRLTYVRNPGAAFSLGGGLTVVFSLVAIVVSIAIVRVAPRLGSLGWAVALGGILGGAVGNLIDRLFRAPGVFRGYVVDWIQVPHFPVFNVADSAIVCSAALMVVLSLRGIGLDGRRVDR